MIEDAELLRRYAQEKSEEAFAELVRRRLGLVYAVALRQVAGDAHLAEDVTQKVFADLARKAAVLAQRPVLSGWLYRSTQFAASDVVRSERRRRAREQESQTMQQINWAPGNAADWNNVRPLIDEALGELNEQDRDAVALRFFEGRGFAEIGARLRLNEEAARKRVERALDKLAVLLSRRGITSTTTALGLALTTHASAVAPAGLASAVTASSLAAGAAAAAKGGLVLAGASVTVKALLGTLGAAATLAAGVAIYQAREAHTRQAALAAAQAQQAGLRRQVSALQEQLGSERARAQAAEDDNARLLAAIAGLRDSSAAAKEGAGSLARDVIDARYRRAQDMMRAENWPAALADLLWCFDDGMTRNSAYSGTRLTVLLGDIAKVGAHYPPALAALRERRAQAEQRMLANPLDEGPAHEFTSLNRALGEEARTLAAYDRFAPDDPRRRQLMLAGAWQLLVTAQRYTDAVQAVPFERMGPWFERESQPPNVANERYPEMALKRHRRIVVSDAALNVEVLAGAGELAHAREFAARVLAFDNSAETRDVLQRHAARAGQPGLLRAVPPP